MFHDTWNFYLNLKVRQCIKTFMLPQKCQTTLIGAVGLEDHMHLRFLCWIKVLNIQIKLIHVIKYSIHVLCTVKTAIAPHIEPPTVPCYCEKLPRQCISLFMVPELQGTPQFIPIDLMHHFQIQDFSSV
jgi:hypothetical protein